MCTFGMCPSTLNASPKPQTVCKAPAATIMDMAPFFNIPPFGMCMSMANPAVVAATIAASGVFTPAPCTPVPAGTWIPNSPTVVFSGIPTLTQSSTLMCSYGGCISITYPGQVQVQIK